MIRTESLNEYFREALTEALARTSTAITYDVQAYVVRMLHEFSRSEHAYSGVDRGEEPVYAILLARARESNAQEALRLYKQVGDSTLYQLGFFKESAAQKLANESYYFSVGEQAYASAAQLTTNAHVGSRIYTELSDRFIELVLVFNEMSAYGERNLEAGTISTERLLMLIEHYHRTQNPQIAEILRKQGVNIPSQTKKS